MVENKNNNSHLVFNLYRPDMYYYHNMSLSGFLIIKISTKKRQKRKEKDIFIDSLNLIT